MIQYSEIEELTTQEIVEKIDESKDSLTRMKLNHNISPLENPLLIRQVRREIAKFKTELRKRELSSTIEEKN
jgi:large subunit ribosomal protein L29